MAGAPRALAGEVSETNNAIARGVTAMVVGSGVLLGFFGEMAILGKKPNHFLFVESLVGPNT
jgi:hypothetical protein